MKVFIVIGATGEYSDHSEWPVVAYADEDMAKDHCDRASVAARELMLQYPREEWKIPRGANIYDPDMRVDYTGVNYYYWPVLVADEVQPLATP